MQDTQLERQHWTRQHVFGVRSVMRKNSLPDTKACSKGREKSGKKQGREARGHSGRIHVVGQDSSYVQQAIFGQKISHLMDRC